jgi:hypothetical protein
MGIRSILLFSISKYHLTASFCCRCSNENRRRPLSSSRWCCAEDADASGESCECDNGESAQGFSQGSARRANSQLELADQIQKLRAELARVQIELKLERQGGFAPCQRMKIPPRANGSRRGSHSNRCESPHMRPDRIRRSSVQALPKTSSRPVAGMLHP